jgi:hypothetical protein
MFLSSLGCAKTVGIVSHSKRQQCQQCFCMNTPHMTMFGQHSFQKRKKFGIFEKVQYFVLLHAVVKSDYSRD